MSDEPGEHLEEEPQSARGAEGSRDLGSDEPGGGPVARAEGSGDEKSDTSVRPQETDSDAPDLQSGGG